MQERIQKIISAAGITSRRAAEEMILEGRVRVNGQVVTELGSKADPENDHIKVDGKLINPKQPKTYIMLNKPVGYVTTLSDPEQRKTVQDLMQGVKVRVYPVGRLDYNTEGMLLLTNDGDFAHLITHPSYELPKTYLVKVKGVLDDRAVNSLETGMYLRDGRTAPARVRRIRKEAANSWVEITIHEGRKRQVRRMIDHVGNSVIRLKRVKIGSLSLGDLPVGTYRHLTLEEVKFLRSLAEGTAGVAGRSSAPKLKASQARSSAPPAKQSIDRAGERSPRQSAQKGSGARTDSRRPVGRKSMPRMEDTKAGMAGRSSAPKMKASPARSARPAAKQSMDRAGERRPWRSEQKGPGARPVSRKPEGRMNTRSFAEGTSGATGRSSTQNRPVRQARSSAPAATQSMDRSGGRGPRQYEQKGTSARPVSRKPDSRKGMRGSSSAKKGKGRFPR